LSLAFSASRSGAVASRWRLSVAACIAALLPGGQTRQPFQPRRAGYRAGMELSLLLIVIGIVLAILVNYPLGIVCILIGLFLLIWPRLRASV
jgi:hypothetical protein